MSLNFNTENKLAYNLLAINGSTVSRGAQSMCLDERNRHLYALEAGAITRYPMDGGVDVSPIDASLINGPIIGHQGLDVEYVDGDIRLWSSSSTVGRAAVRFKYEPGKALDKGEVYILFKNGTFANNSSCTPSVSNCGGYLIAHGARITGTVSTVHVFDLKALIAGGPGDYSDKWLYEFVTDDLVRTGSPVQGTACDGNYVYIIAGSTGFDAAANKRLHVYTLSGSLVFKEDDFRVGEAAALGDPNATRYEPEGLCLATGKDGKQKLYAGILSGDPGMRRYRVYEMNAYPSCKMPPTSFPRKDRMLASMVRYFNKIRSTVVPIVFDKSITIAAGGTKTYDLKTLMTDHALYELRSAKLTTLILNTEAGAPTNGYHINAEAYITTGIADTGVIILHNPTSDPATVTVRIDRPTVKK